MISKIQSKLLYGGLEKHEYHSLKQDIHLSNRSSLLLYCTISCCFLTLISLISYCFPNLLVKEQYVYISPILLVGGLLLITIFNKNHSLLTTFCVHGFIYIHVIMGIAISIFSRPDAVAVTFMVIIFAAPLLFVTSALSMSLDIIISILFFEVLAYFNKPLSIFHDDTVNAIIFGCVGIIVGSSLMNIKISRLLYFRKTAQLSEIDQLTGVYNRRFYELEQKRIEPILKEKNVALAVVDINGLKEANDKLGHEVGDELIIGTAQCIQKALGNKGRCFRIGGDEFVVIIENYDSFNDKDFEVLLYNAIKQWRGTYISKLSCSCGIAFSQKKDTITLHQLSQLADYRMYDKKRKYYENSHRDRRKTRSVL